MKKEIPIAGATLQHVNYAIEIAFTFCEGEREV